MVCYCFANRSIDEYQVVEEQEVMRRERVLGRVAALDPLSRDIESLWHMVLIRAHKLLSKCGVRPPSFVDPAFLLEQRKAASAEALRQEVRCALWVWLWCQSVLCSNERIANL